MDKISWLKIKSRVVSTEGEKEPIKRATDPNLASYPQWDCK